MFKNGRISYRLIGNFIRNPKIRNKITYELHFDHKEAVEVKYGETLICSNMVKFDIDSLEFSSEVKKSGVTEQLCKCVGVTDSFPNA